MSENCKAVVYGVRLQKTLEIPLDKSRHALLLDLSVLFCVILSNPFPPPGLFAHHYRDGAGPDQV